MFELREWLEPTTLVLVSCCSAKSSDAGGLETAQWCCCRSAICKAQTLTLLWLVLLMYSWARTDCPNCLAGDAFKDLKPRRSIIIKIRNKYYPDKSSGWGRRTSERSSGWNWDVRKKQVGNLGTLPGTFWELLEKLCSLFLTEKIF